MKNLVLAFICLLLAVPSQAEIIIVDDDWPYDFNNIQAAVDYSTSGDFIFVFPGTYTGQGNYDIDFFGRAITVQSVDPEDPYIVAATVIDCNGQGRGFYFHSGEDGNSVVDGLTITHAYPAICCIDGSSPEITNCTIEGDTAYEGGGIYCTQSSPTITDCIINNSSGEHGGAIDCQFDSNPTIINCTISNSSAARGGGISCQYNSSATITNCTITGNWAYFGGGIYCQDSNVVITNCTISGNTANDSGGGIDCRYNSSLIITNCTISGNTATNRDGGGIYCQDSNAVITNCTISGNTAEDHGGGGIWCRDSNAVITNCSITENSAEDLDGGIDCTASAVITNCIIWNNKTSSYYPSELAQITGGIVTFSCIQNWTRGGQGNINQNPRFAFDTDYHLMWDSPCINAGDLNFTAGPNETDLDGNPRLTAGRVDMGAYEYNPNRPSIAVSAADFSYAQGGPEPDPKTLLIRNCGGQTLNWEIVEDCNWLQAAPTNGVSTRQINEVTLTVDPNSLATGYYSCILTVLDPNAVNSPVAVLVSLHVGELLRVPQQFLTIQDAIDEANDYDMVLVADATYTGPGNQDIDFLGKAITVKSENGPDNCIIDCNGTEADPHRGFYFQNGESAASVLDGFTITNGYAPYGGGICCWYSSPTIKNCLVTGNSAEYVGGIGCYLSYSAITNCTITGNKAVNCGGAIFCDNSTITNCIISGNKAGDYAGGIWLYGFYSNPTIENCTITGNSAQTMGGGIYSDYGNPTINNCILWDNEAPNGPQIYLQSSQEIQENAWISYNNLQGGQADVYIGPGVELHWGPGNIDEDPCFVQPGYWEPNGTPEDANDDFWIDGDYHLKSEGWRWDTQRKIWTWDDVTSRCIDAGNPGSALGEEPLSVSRDPNNDWGQNIRINMGAFGGTAEASIPPYNWTILADLTNDGTIDLLDLAHWAENWLLSGSKCPGDLDRNAITDMLDFALLAQDYFAETTWYE